MKKLSIFCLVIFLVSVFFVGCGASADGESVQSDQPTVTPAATPTAEPAGADDEGDASSYYIDVAYADQIKRYYTALSEKWDEGKYFENEMSALPYYYYDGNPLDNVGFGFVDLDNDGSPELVIGAIMNAEIDPTVFEIWTMVNGEPVMLARGGTRNRYVLQHIAEDGMWYVANEGSGSAFNHVIYYLMLNEGKFEVVHGIIFDAMADEQNPWFMTYDLDGDVSNDMPIDEETAIAIMDSNRIHYTAIEYFPYSLYDPK